MILQRCWAILAVESIFICISSQFLLQKRQCVFHVTPQNNKYVTAGNVSGSVQVCENTHCCVGYFLIVNGQPEVDLLACDIAEKSCPDATCKAQTRFNSRLIKCVCHTDFCNSNISWTPDSEQPGLTYSCSADAIMKAVVIILIGTLLILCFMIAAAKWRRLLKDKKGNLQVYPHDYVVSPLSSCQTTKTTEIDVADIELQQILGHGHFATVWQGKYHGSTVAVKVFPASWKHKFTVEKEVYELPLMKHAGLLHFLGTGSKANGSSFLIVLQCAEYVSDVHKPPVAHRDLSSSNVLVKADGTCALCDFGCSTILRSCSGHLNWNHTTNTEGPAQLGTLHYMSPEILEGSVNLNSCWCLIQGDIYALGLLLWEIWMRCDDLFEGSVVPQHLLPYEAELGNVTLESLITYVFNMDKRPSIPKHWKLLPQGSALQELLTDCWDCDPDARLTSPCVVDRLASLQSCYSP
ncbi:anti-Muellerian hormone type-2 receptor-like [Toxotes jaculatrix]|uniref:anti-Muellerian hormone type-2 receptor-like n=1 Tax=Toxotes jaculatrix TaxID=941984 RepID=UPI001B3ABD6A|nr:anti-Muellerian hormone type-2 receptor-like [Toxotes jaculatrix]